MSATVSINSQALVNNLRIIKAKAPKSRIIAMVKANAYGCGLEVISHNLRGRVAAFGVANLQEALTLKYKLGCSDRIIIFQGFDNLEQLATIKKNNFSVVISDWQQLGEITTGFSNQIWLKFNTGMNRLGFQLEDSQQVLAYLKKHQLTNCGLLTHFACATVLQHPLNKQQQNNFLKLTNSYFKFRSAANSALILSRKDLHFDYIRPGLILYGISPFEKISGSHFGLRPILSFKTTVKQIYTVSKGQAVGYNSKWIAAQTETIAVLSAGYGDGYPRSVTNNTFVYINGEKCQIIGVISMDSMTVLVSGVTLKVGDLVELWGENIAIEDVASAANTIAYELLCKLSSRVVRY